MSWLNFITNIFGLLLWLNWIAVRYPALVHQTGVSLAGTIRKADSSRRKQWFSLLAIAGIILFRGFLYYIFQAYMKLDLGLLLIGFRGKPGYASLFGMLLFSLLSMLVWLGGFYAWLTLLSIVNFQTPDDEPIQKIVRRHFNWLEGWPRFLKSLLPFAGGVAFWMAVHPLLVWDGILQKTKSAQQLWLQSFLVGGSSYLLWKHLIAGILLLHLLNSYVYLGKHPFWNFINTTARNMLLPLSWIPLRLGKVDFLPVAAIALVFLAAELFVRIPVWYFRWMPF